VEFVITGVVGKLTGVGKDATGLKRVDAANVEFDAGAVTPITTETGIGVVTPIVFETLAPLTGVWVDCSCVL
jgi:hypothetical protein